MKKIRNLKIVFIITFFVCLLSAVMCFSTTATASATQGKQTFVMETGAAARLTEPSGVKFIATISSSEYDENAKYGMLIVPYDYFKKAGVTVSDKTDYVNAFKAAKTAGKISKDPIISTEIENRGVSVNKKADKYELTYSITNLYKENYRRQWFGVAFIDNGDGTYEYATFNDNVRSIVEVASLTLNSNDPELTTDDISTLENFVKESVAQKIGNQSFIFEISNSSVAEIGKPLALSTNLPSDLNLDVKWSSSNTDIATIDTNGQITFVKDGSVNVTARVGNLYCAEMIVRTHANMLEVEMVGRTRTSNMQQMYVYDDEYVKNGMQSVKCVYGADSSNDLTEEIATYKVTNGGLLFLMDSNFETVYDKFSAYDATNRTYASDTEKTYVGFWVKNTTGKKLILNVNLRLWGNGAVVRGVNTLNSLEDASVIQASDTSWRYYEVELDKSKLPTLVETFPVIRLSLAVQIEGAEVGDTFYIDSFDIYHGSRMPQDEEPLETYVDLDPLGDTLISKTISSVIKQESTTEVIKDGQKATKCTYGGAGLISSYAVINGGVLYCPDNSETAVCSALSAYDSINHTFASSTEKTYAGFWVKNTTSKRLTVSFNLILWDSSNTQVRLKGTGVGVNYIDDGKIIRANNTEWNYYELELPNDKLPNPMHSSSPIIRMAIACRIDGAENGDTFYIDSFDIYHGSRMPKNQEPLETYVNLDTLGVQLVNGTRTSNISQAINTESVHVKEGVQSLKCIYGGSENNASYNIDNGGLVLLADDYYQSIYDKFTAYDATDRTYVSDTEKTYVGFWVKNTTGKKLSANINLRLWGTINGSSTIAVLNGIVGLTQTNNGIEIEASDTSWHYYEVELDSAKLPVNMPASNPILRMALAVQIEGAEVGDTFYIDSFDIYHGSKA